VKKRFTITVSDFCFNSPVSVSRLLSLSSTVSIQINHSPCVGILAINALASAFPTRSSLMYESEISNQHITEVIELTSLKGLCQYVRDHLVGPGPFNNNGFLFYLIGNPKVMDVDVPSSG
jgi:hypothetical protein